jgi:hypothetical protein
MGWSGLIWFRIGTSGGLLWTQYWTFGFHKMLGSSWVAAQLAAPQEGLSSVCKYVSKLYDSFIPIQKQESELGQGYYQYQKCSICEIAKRHNEVNESSYIEDVRLHILTENPSHSLQWDYWAHHRHHTNNAALLTTEVRLASQCSVSLF